MDTICCSKLQIYRSREEVCGDSTAHTALRISNIYSNTEIKLLREVFAAAVNNSIISPESYVHLSWPSRHFTPVELYLLL